MTPPDASSTSTTGETITAPATRRVLIVDDADDIRTLVRLVLSTSPRFEVVGEAADGNDAIEQTRQLRPDLVLLDLSMPGMDGLEALPHLRALGAAVIVLSGYATHVMADRAMEAGAIGYLEKGGSPREIIDALDQLLGGNDGPTVVLPPLTYDRTLPPAVRVMEIVDDLLASIATTPVNRPQSPANLIEAAVAAIEATGEPTSRVAWLGSGPATVATPDVATAILVELVTNALRHGEGTPVDISVHGSVIRVASGGPGLGVTEPEIVFLPGIVGRSANAGDGLGLAVAAELSRRAELRVWLEMDPSGPVFVLDVDPT